MPIILTLTAVQTAVALTKRRKSRRRIALWRGSFMLWNGENLDFKRFSDIEKVHHNSIELRWTYGGEGGIRTLDTLVGYTRFPIVRARPGYATSPRSVRVAFISNCQLAYYNQDSS